MNYTDLAVILQLIWLEGILSIDNAAVIAVMAAALPHDTRAPWPVSWLGMQPAAALKAGIFGAYAGRGLMLVAASWVIQYPIFTVAGALYLLYLSYCHWFRCGDDEDGKRVSGGFWKAVVMIEIADLTFSIDNVVAVTVLSDRLVIVLIGVFIGIALMRFAAGIFTVLVDRVPNLTHAAYLLITAIALELLAARLLGLHLSEVAQFGIALAIIAGTIGIPWCWHRSRTLFAYGGR